MARTGTAGSIAPVARDLDVHLAVRVGLAARRVVQRRLAEFSDSGLSGARRPSVFCTHGGEARLRALDRPLAARGLGGTSSLRPTCSCTAGPFWVTNGLAARRPARLERRLQMERAGRRVLAEEALTALASAVAHAGAAAD